MLTEGMIRGIGMTSLRTRERLIQRLRRGGITNTEVMEVILNTPRHLFVDEALASRAYEDTALPIGHRQTISQPYIVARMTELLLENKPLNRVLEIGTGCGYQTVVLAQLAPQVYTVERIEALLKQARKRFRLLKFSNIRSKYSDGTWGWEEHAPYDGILVTAAAPSVPPRLLQQLAVDGRLVIPIGASGTQELIVITRTRDGYEQDTYDKVSFVPLRGGEE